MKIDLYSDMVCPWCRIGKKNMSDAISAWEASTGETIEVNYHAYMLSHDLPPEGQPFNSAMEKKMGGPEKLRPMLQRVTEAGAAVGVTFNFDQVERMPHTELAHRVTALLNTESQEIWLDAVMKAYFEDGRDIAQLSVLLEIADELGIDVEALRQELDAGNGKEAVQDDFTTARNIGISGVPFFILDGKYALSGAYPANQFLEAFQKIKQQTQS
ncbi:MAG: DsbA family oxidoreductase [Candidatus Cohnella colombiensis]|uniref:DsbA family oxidoreductase n=1 Tax=Candidatus Cohnella colombiensis TaxID=3121368 RepID=A0AA95EV66_9BACL|nr:MAG: DsbA family oxidoreductase [Cohnella sp.]